MVSVEIVFGLIWRIFMRHHALNWREARARFTLICIPPLKRNRFVLPCQYDGKITAENTQIAQAVRLGGSLFLYSAHHRLNPIWPNPRGFVKYDIFQFKKLRHYRKWMYLQDTPTANHDLWNVPNISTHWLARKTIKASYKIRRLKY